MAPTRNDPIAHRESLSIWFDFHGKLGNDGAISAPNFLGQARDSPVDTTSTIQSRHRNRASFRRKRTLMRSGVDPPCETADHGQARVGKLIRQFLRRLRAVMGRAPRADDADGMMIALLQFTPNIKHNWRRVNLAQRLRIRWRLLCDYSRVEIADSIKLGCKIDNRFPVCDLICNFVSDSFGCSKLAARCGREPAGVLRKFPAVFAAALVPRSAAYSARCRLRVEFID